ncbi:MAG: hypothetical protein N2050_04830 [Flavobacteriales bacterium]|nr:hypothetical protein [Flavobacteriales bacterium]
MKNVVIKSIGNAKPQTVNALAETFAVDKSALLKLVYSAPAVFLKNVDEATAKKAEQLLKELGFEAEIKNDDFQIPPSSELYDIALYLDEPHKLHTVAQQLADFCGMKPDGALQLLLNDPATVLGNVSYNTALALQKRVDAEVMISNPLKANYTITISDGDPIRMQNFYMLAQQLGLNIKGRKVTSLTYNQMQNLLQQIKDSSLLRIVNEDFIRYRVVLNRFDKNNPASVQFLIQTIGMPDELVSRLEHYLPVYIEESLAAYNAVRLFENCKKAGLECTVEPVPFEKYHLKVEIHSNPSQVKKIVEPFFGEMEINTKVWRTPKPMTGILNRLLASRLERIGCRVEPEYT